MHSIYFIGTWNASNIYIYIYIYMYDPHYQDIGQMFDNHYTRVTIIYSITIDYGELYFPSMVRQTLCDLKVL